LAPIWTKKSPFAKPSIVPHSFTWRFAIDGEQISVTRKVKDDTRLVVDAREAEDSDLSCGAMMSPDRLSGRSMTGRPSSSTNGLCCRASAKGPRNDV